MLKKLFGFHILPFSLALTLVVLGLLALPKQEIEFEIENINANQGKYRGFYANLNGSDQAEIDLLASLTDTNQITLFGSSEFGDSPFIPFHFLPDSMGIPTLGIGHAWHQQFAILTELLAFSDSLRNQKICIILSPGWFGNNGTNSMAFAEFAKPSLLNRILHNDKIAKKYKLWLGSYVNHHENDLTNLSNSMVGLRHLYLDNNQKTNPKKYLIEEKRKAKVKLKKFSVHPVSKKTKPLLTNLEDLKKKTQNRFLNSITNNKLYVNDKYYSAYIIDEQGNRKVRDLQPIDIKHDKEYEDFLLLLDFIDEQKINASFIIQALHPFVYDNIKDYDPLIQQITTKLDQHNIPCLNLWTSSKDLYEPGTLRDVMHMGDYGWIKSNQFLINTYNLNKQ